MTTHVAHSSISAASATAPILLLGGTGKTGRRVAERLLARGVAVRSLGRSTPIPFDWSDRRTWDAAIAGSRRAYLAYSPDLATPGALDDVREITERLADVGAERIVLLSGRGEPEAVAAEDVVKESGLEWSIARCAWFFQNFTEGYLRDPLARGALYLPAGRISEPFVDADDIADVAVAALLDPGHAGQLYELTGPESLTFQAVVDIASKYTGHPVAYIPVTVEEYLAGARADGLPDDILALLEYLFRIILDGRNKGLADGVQRALGREPRSFEAFAREAAATGVWS